MTGTGFLAMPWAPGARGYCAPRRLVVKLALGEAPERVPTRSDVRAGRAAPQAQLGHGALDRLLRRFGGQARIARLHDAARAREPGQRHHGFDDLEHTCGVARIFEVALAEHCNVPDAVDALRQLDIVDWATPHYFCVAEQDAPAPPPPPKDAHARASTMERIGATRVHEIEPGDPAVVVAVIDTGTAKRHPELAGQLRAGFDAVNFRQEEVGHGLALVGDFSARDIDPDEAHNGHGTACASLLKARGAVLHPGLAGECGAQPVRALASAMPPGGDKVVGLGAIPDIEFAFKHAIDLGARIVNMSFGTSRKALAPGDPPPHAETVAYAIARGAVPVAASGNTATDELIYPAALPGVIAVGAVDADDRPATFTTRGRHVALCAPGERLLAADIEGYQWVTGTSFAAPLVAGAAALLVSRALRNAVALSAAEIRHLLVRAARPWRMDTGAGEGVGAGTLDIGAALAALDRRLATSTDFESAALEA